MLDQDRHRREVIDRNVEEALDLAGMKIDTDHPVSAGDGQHVSQQLRGNRLTAARLAILPRVTVNRAYGGDPFGRRTFGGVDHDQLLHDVVVDRVGVRLHDEHVRAADRLAEGATHFSAGKVDEVGMSELNVQVVSDLVRKLWIRTSGKELKTLRWGKLHGNLPSGNWCAVQTN